jgi:hypothetical protein
MSVMAESVVAIWSAPVVFVRLGAGAFTVKEKLALSVLSVAFFAVTVYTPALPAGLSIDSATCTISGTPTEVRARTVYTVTAKNATDNFTVKEKLALSSSVAFFAVTVYTLRALTSVGTPLMVQVALSILKPAGSVGVTVQQTK